MTGGWLGGRTTLRVGGCVLPWAVAGRRGGSGVGAPIGVAQRGAFSPRAGWLGWVRSLVAGSGDLPRPGWATLGWVDGRLVSRGMYLYQGWLALLRLSGDG